MYMVSMRAQSCCSDASMVKESDQTWAGTFSVHYCAGGVALRRHQPELRNTGCPQAASVAGLRCRSQAACPLLAGH